MAQRARCGGAWVASICKNFNDGFTGLQFSRGLMASGGN
jgi:hypothetical protein